MEQFFHANFIIIPMQLGRACNSELFLNMKERKKRLKERKVFVWLPNVWPLNKNSFIADQEDYTLYYCSILYMYHVLSELMGRYLIS